MAGALRALLGVAAVPLAMHAVLATLAVLIHLHLSVAGCPLVVAGPWNLDEYGVVIEDLFYAGFTGRPEAVRLALEASASLGR